MPLGFRTEVIERLWNTISLIKKEKTRNEILQITGESLRIFNSDIHRLKSIGLNIKFSRNKDKYSIDFPDKTVALKLEQKEFFWVYYICMGISSSHDEELKTKLKLTMANEADSVLDGTEVYGVAQNLFISNPLLTNIKEAIHEHLKVVFYYKSLSSAASLRIVHPYKLIHTPVSWYLLGYCEDRKNFRNFKLTRIDKFKVMNDKFHPHKFNLSELIGDSWWLRYDPEKLENPYKVKVLFTDEAALSIKEYIFHSSQKIQDHKNGTIVEWELSYLGEFASWLMQWMPDFEIESPKELKNIINQRISEYQK